MNETEKLSERLQKNIHVVIYFRKDAHPTIIPKIHTIENFITNSILKWWALAFQGVVQLNEVPVMNETILNKIENWDWMQKQLAVLINYK